MKIVKLILIALILPSTLHAQINDADAKIAYQRSENWYNTAGEHPRIVMAYYQTLQLSRRMKQWVPKTLYLNLKSAYSFFQFIDKDPRYDPPIPEQPADQLRADYKSFSLLERRCDTLLQLVANQTYPAEKIAETKSIQLYFKEMAAKHAYEKDRKPQDAIDFLNDCLRLFGSAKEGDNDYRVYQSWKGAFALEGSVLVVYGRYLKSVFYSGRNNNDDSQHGKKEVRIDLTKVQLKDGQMIGTNIMLKELITNTHTSFDRVLKDFDKQGFQSAANYKVFDDFLVRSVGNDDKAMLKSFKEGNYEQRITDALQFLVDAFPKHLEAEKPKPAARVSKF